MRKTSAGILMYRRIGDSIEIFLIHPGGPFWAKKDSGAWSIPKGEINPDEDTLSAARREFNEETGSEIDGDFISLEPIRQKGGKIVSAWAVEGSIDANTIRSDTFSMEWPPRSGRQAEFPEVDRAGWFNLADAREKLIPAQVPFIDELYSRVVKVRPGPRESGVFS